MIISASRRTDIPAFYSDWLFNRLAAGFVCVRNPMNYHQVSRIRLTADVVDCIVFWTKNPAAMLKRHRDDLRALTMPYYFQFTVTPYDQSIERYVPSKDVVCETFAELSALCGKERVIWRYDPILLTESLTPDYHCQAFEALVRRLAPYTTTCVMSFVDLYKKIAQNMGDIRYVPMSLGQQLAMSRTLQQIATAHHLKLVTCAEQIDLSSIGIAHGSCIDPKLISRLCGGTVMCGKDKRQRAECGCVESIDIGAYNTCPHGCCYCYANTSSSVVAQQSRAHNPLSPLLAGDIQPEDTITEREVKSVISKQIQLFG